MSCGLVVLVTLSACKRGGNEGPEPEAPPALATYAAQRVVLTPTARVRAPDSAALVRAHGSSLAVGRALDGAIAARMRELGVGGHWVLPDELVRAWERNRTYASDPYQLAVEPIRSANFAADKKFGEPLSSQLRTMVALHEDTRFVLLPIELRVESEQAHLRVALLDPRTAEARWVGTIASDSTATTPAQSLTQVAERLINLFFAP
jgi:hypothetical protein